MSDHWINSSDEMMAIAARQAQAEPRTLWKAGTANFACTCGNWMVVSTEPHICRLCGRVWRVDVRVVSDE